HRGPLWGLAKATFLEGVIFTWVLIYGVVLAVAVPWRMKAPVVTEVHRSPGITDSAINDSRTPNSPTKKLHNSLRKVKHEVI
ncbi:hypothetical protein ED312_22140, partial [Sinomicrobium pectinilyticum]